MTPPRPTFVTLTTLGDPTRVADLRDRLRTVGVFQRAEDALAVLVHNWGDLNEAGWYRYAVVEEFEFGLYPPAQRRVSGQQWFEYRADPTERWVRLDDVPDAIAVWARKHFGRLLLASWASVG